MTEVAARIGMTPATLQNAVIREKGKTFSEYKTEKFDCGNSYIREVQFKLAVVEKDKTMLLWLGRNRLGQTDNPVREDEFNGELKELLTDLREKYQKEKSEGLKP